MMLNDRRTQLRVWLLVAGAATGYLIGCQGSDSKSESPTATVLTVENPPERSTVRLGPALGAEPLRQFPELELSGVRSIRLLHGGRLVLSNNGSSQLIFLDIQTRKAKPVGRSGYGPGEFQSIPLLARCAGDTVVVYSTIQRLSFFDADGGFVRVRDAPGFRRGVDGVSADCSSVVIHGLERRAAIGKVKTDLVTFSWHDASGDSVRTIGSIPGPETGQALFHGREAFLPLPFGNLPSMAVFGDMVYLASGDLTEVKIYDRTRGLVRIVRWTAKAPTLTSADRARHDSIRVQLDTRFGQGTSEDFPASEVFDLPSTKPYLSRILVDDRGFMWVQRYPQVWEGFERIFGVDFGTADSEWWLFDPSGNLQGVTTMPRGLGIRDIADSLVAGVARDQNDVERVVVYRLSDTVLRLRAEGRGKS
ncbi:MAG: hypothetical protein HOP28_15290 [Gemmatimonadales bacterium]|nr:hypothetical protein [Gemmatimonadales bacterium]